MNKKLSLILIIILGFILRIIFINNNSLYGDELTITLDSSSLLKTAHDQLGNLLPLTFQMGAGRPAGYVYGSIPFIAIFGPNELGVRALSILSGLGVIILLYYICRKLFSEKIGLLAAFISAVSIWDISLSRGGFEAHFALCLALLSIYLFILAKEKPILYILSALSFGLTLHTYPTYKVILVLFLPLLFWFIGVKKIKEGKNYFFAAIIIFILLGFLSLSQTFIGGSETRFSNINIFSQESLNQQIEQKIDTERQINTLPKSISKYFHNKGVEYTKVLIENYLQNFSLDFLILHGDRNPRHNMATMGEIYFVEIILILIGILTFWYKSKKVVIFLLIWIFISSVATAIVDLPHALRSAFMLPPLIILSALGLSVIFSKKYRILLSFLALIFIVQFIFFIQKLYFLAPTLYANFWAHQAKEASETALREKDKYEYIFLSDNIDNIEFAYPVYAKIEPQQIQKQNKQKVKLDRYDFKKFDNIYIGYLPQADLENFWKNLNGRILYIGVDKFNKLVFLNKEL